MKVGDKIRMLTTEDGFWCSGDTATIKIMNDDCIWAVFENGEEWCVWTSNEGEETFDFGVLGDELCVPEERLKRLLQAVISATCPTVLFQNDFEKMKMEVDVKKDRVLSFLEDELNDILYGE